MLSCSQFCFCLIPILIQILVPMSLRVMILSQNLCIENVESTEISSIVKSSETKTKRPRIAISNLYSGWKKSIITPHIPIFDLVTGNENETQAFDTNNDLNLPIVIRKGIRSCTHHLISQFVFFFLSASLTSV